MMMAAALVAATVCSKPKVAIVAHMGAVRISLDRMRPRFIASARVTFAVRVGNMPRTSDPGVRAHDAGYEAIARRIAVPATADAVGNTAAQARARLSHAGSRLAADLNAEYAREAAAYDTVTENGRSQSLGPQFGFPGGPDAVTCSL